MNKNQLAPLIDSLIPGLYTFSFCLIPDELQAEQLIVDAYSVFIIREGEMLRDWELDAHAGAKQRAQLKRYAQNQLLTDILDLAKKRAPQLQSLFRGVQENKEFYQLELLQRAALCLKENLRYAHSDLEEIFALKKHQVIELLHNSRARLTSGATVTMEAHQ